MPAIVQRNENTGQSAELCSRGRRLRFQLIDDCGEQLLALLDELAVTLQPDALPKKA